MAKANDLVGKVVEVVRVVNVDIISPNLSFGLSVFRTSSYLLFQNNCYTFVKPIYEHTKAFSFFPGPHFHE